MQKHLPGQIQLNEIEHEQRDDLNQMLAEDGVLPDQYETIKRYLPIEQKWQRVVDTYKRLVQNAANDRVGLTDRQYDFVKRMHEKCFGQVYMHQPSEHMINRLYEMTLDLPT